MVRTFSRPIFRRKSRLRLRSILGSALLLLSVGALVAGVFGALYLDHFRPALVTAARHAPPAAREDVVSTAAAETMLPPPAPPAAPGAESPPAPSIAAPPQPPVEESAGSSMPPVAAQDSPAPAPPTQQAHEGDAMLASLPPQPMVEEPAAAAPPPTSPMPAAAIPAAEPPAASDAYWVEYGAYTAAPYAERLRRSLAALGIDTTVSYLPGRGGRHYYSVRSAPVAERADARTALAKASEALHIAPLLHHEHPDVNEETAQTAGSSLPRQAPASAERGRYWVQFGVFAVHHYAERFEARLQSGGIAATISPHLRSGGRTLYYIRSSALPDQESANALAQRARTLLGTAVLVGRSDARNKG